MADQERPALARAAALLGVDPAAPPLRDGYVDLVGGREPPSTGVAQRLMRTSLVPAIYERWWRPALGRVAKGPRGPSMAGELRLARQLLSVEPGETVIDVACGPGNVTRALAEDAGTTGTVVGLDLSPTMLARAVRDTTEPQVVYVRGDVTALSIETGSADAVSCFAALHLFSSPGAALDVMAGALAPGGRLALLTSARPRRRVPALAVAAAGRLGGMAIFRTDALADELSIRGLEVTYQRSYGVMQVLAARWPAASG